MATGNDMETSLFGIKCNHRNRQASITKQKAKEIYHLVHETNAKRDEKAEIARYDLCMLEEKRSNGSLSDEEQKVCEVWDNLNYALKEMKATFCDEFKRDVFHFSVTAEKSCYNFLVALAEFDALYSVQI